MKNLELFGAGNILVTSETPESGFLDYFEGWFDKILVDAPCSGEGMFRKDTVYGKRAGWSMGRNTMRGFSRRFCRDCSGENARDREGCSSIPPAPFLLWKTRRNLKKLLEAEQELEILPLSTGEWFREGLIPGTLRIWPQDIRGEGHFTALLRKKGQAPEHTQKDRRRTTVLPEGLSEFASLFSAPGLKPGQAGCAERVAFTFCRRIFQR